MEEAANEELTLSGDLERLNADFRVVVSILILVYFKWLLRQGLSQNVLLGLQEQRNQSARL